MRAPQVLVVNAALNVGTLKEFVALAQANPGKFNYGSAGSGGQFHLVAKLFNMAARIKTVHVPYKSGKVRALAVTSGGKRLPALSRIAWSGAT